MWHVEMLEALGPASACWDLYAGDKVSRVVNAFEKFSNHNYKRFEIRKNE